MRIAVVSQHDLTDVLPLSGTGFSMVKALERQGADVDVLGPIQSQWTRIGRHLDRVLRTFGKGYNFYHSRRVSRDFGRQLARRIGNGRHDIIFAPMASAEIAFLATELPIVYLSDMTYGLARFYYPFFSNLLSISDREGMTIERRAVQNAVQIVVPSEWAAGSFHDNYGCEQAKLNVVPFGANLADPPTREDALTLRNLDVCRLLFLGVDWERKGGPVVLEVLHALLAAGVNAELVVCGCKPPAGTPRTGIQVVPFLRKNNPSDSQRLRDLFLSSTFLILPTKADAAPIVFAEASAYGLPSLTRQTGGTATMVRDGFNGFCLPADAAPEQYAARITGLLGSPEQYRALCLSSRDEYESRLNWDTWAIQVMNVLTRAVQMKREPLVEPSHGRDERTCDLLANGS